jgi:hypothetical protein
VKFDSHIFGLQIWSSHHNVDIPADHNIPPLIPRFLPKLTQILSNYQQDPSHLVSLSIKLLGPISFTDVLSLASEESLIRALQSPAPSANILGLTVVAKAASSPSNAAILSSMKALVEQLITTWLSTPNVEVAGKATRTLGDLLEVDCDRRPSDPGSNEGLEVASRKPPGQGFLWRRLFHDRDVYTSLFSFCDLSTTGTGTGQLDQRQKSLAQARLLRVLPRLATLNFPAISKSHLPEVEKQFDMEDGTEGLLWYAGLEMVDIEEDVLMHFTLIDFYAELLEALSIVEMSPTSMNYLCRLVKTATEENKDLYLSLQSLAEAESSSPELVDLLRRLDEYK